VFASEAEHTAKHYSVRAALVDLTLEDCTPDEYVVHASRATALRIPTILVISPEDRERVRAAIEGLGIDPAVQWSIQLLERPFDRTALTRAILDAL
jgi:hypothetical protein